MTATFPLWLISATGPGSTASSGSPQSATRSGSETIPLPFGPHTGIPPAAAINSRLQVGGPRLGEPRREHHRPLHPISRARARTRGASAAGKATTTASGTSGRSSSAGTAATPCTDARRGFTAYTRPG